MLNTDNKNYKLYDHGVIVPIIELSNLTENANFKVLSGSRLLFDLFVKEISIGGSITVEFYNNFSVDGDIPDDLVLTITSTNIGHFKKILTDFQYFFNAKITIVGTVKFALALSVFDNAITTVIENAEIDVHTSSKDTPTRAHDSMRIGDQTAELDINPNGSINVNTFSLLKPGDSPLFLSDVADTNPGNNVIVLSETYTGIKERILYSFGVSCYVEGVASLFINGIFIHSIRTAPGKPDAEFLFKPYMTANSLIEIVFRARENSKVQEVIAFVQGSLITI